MPRLVLMHSNETENVTAAYAGDIVAMVGKYTVYFSIHVFCPMSVCLWYEPAV